MVRPDHPYAANSYAAPNSLQRYDITLTPGSHCRPCEPPVRLTTPLPCILTTPQKKTLPGGTYQVVWSAAKPSSVNIPLLPAGAVQTTTSAVTPTSSGQSEPLDWSGS
jgi:hypothetical protein